MVLTQQWAKANPVIHFSVMHPGWVDTLGTDLLRKQATDYFNFRLHLIETDNKLAI